MSPVLNENDVQTSSSPGLRDSVAISETNTVDASNTSPLPPIPQAASIMQLPIADRTGLHASEGNVHNESALECGVSGSSSLDVAIGEGVSITRTDIC